jgi:thioredoxin-related protein
MRISKISSGLAAACLIFIFSLAFTHPTSEANDKKLQWYTWQEAVELQKTNPKKIFVDVYTDWCGWCKRMDKTTFNDDQVSKYLGEHFYPVKLDAEMKEDIEYNGHTFKFVKSGRRGAHMLAYSLLEGRMSYPTVVFLNEKMERVMISPGYKDANQFMTELKFVAEEHYTNKSFDQFRKGL